MVCVHWIPDKPVKVFLFDIPEPLKRVLKASLVEKAFEPTDTDGPYLLFWKISSAILSLYDKSVWAIRDHVSRWEAYSRYQEPNYPQLYELARHATHVSETLKVASRSMESIMQQGIDFNNRLQARWKSARVWHEHDDTPNLLALQHQFLCGLLDRADSNKARIQNEISLVSIRHIVQQRTFRG